MPLRYYRFEEYLEAIPDPRPGQVMYHAEYGYVHYLEHDPGRRQVHFADRLNARHYDSYDHFMIVLFEVESKINNPT